MHSPNFWRDLSHLAVANLQVLLRNPSLECSNHCAWLGLWSNLWYWLVRLKTILAVRDIFTLTRKLFWTIKTFALPESTNLVKGSIFSRVLFNHCHNNLVWCHPKLVLEFGFKFSDSTKMIEFALHSIVQLPSPFFKGFQQKYGWELVAFTPVDSTIVRLDFLLV